METIFKYKLGDVLNDVNNEPELIPYWVKLDLLDNGVPIEIEPLRVSDNLFEVRSGNVTYTQTEKEIIVIWSK